MNESEDTDVISDVCRYDKTEYYKGLGGPYYYRTDGCWEIDKTTETNTLLYYKKGTSAWGTPIVISGLELTNDAGITVYRNAAKDVLRVEFSNPVDHAFVKIFDLTGVLLLHKEIYSDVSEIDLKTFHQGMDVYQVGVNEEMVKSGKFVLY
jgi:hypothetical protein